jgi:hypothetical protein
LGSYEKGTADILRETPASVGLPTKFHVRFKHIAEHVIAFTWAELGIELQMTRFPRDEICMIVAEDTDLVKKTVKMGHAALRDADEVDRWFRPFKFLGLPLQKVVDTPHFAAKAESAPLQIADTCAFLIMRRLMRRSETPRMVRGYLSPVGLAPRD